MEALDLAVRLWSVRASPLVHYGEGFAGVTPHVGAVGLPLSESTRSTVTPRWANRSTARCRTPEAVMAVSSSWTSA